MLYFAEYLRQQRLANDLTMQALSSRLGVSPQYVSLLEGGHRHPSDKLVQRCAEEFDGDLNYLRFLAQSIPEAQKRAVVDAPSAPEYLPESLHTTIVASESGDELVRRLLDVPGVPKPEEDTPFYFADGPSLSEQDIGFQRHFIQHLRRNVDRFPVRSLAWAEFFDAHYERCLGGREEAREHLRGLHDRIKTETTEPYPARLRFLVALHLALSQPPDGDPDFAVQLYRDAHDDARAAASPGDQACALWHVADVSRRRGDLLGTRTALEEALAIPDIPPFAISRCLSDLALCDLALWDDQQAIERAETAIRLWRSATVHAPQERKSLYLVRMEAAALEACLRLDDEEAARRWLSRIRSIRVRITLPIEDDCHVAVLTGTLLRRKGRYTQAKKHLDRARSVLMPDGDTGLRMRASALTQLSLAAIGEGRLAVAEELLDEADGVPPLNSAAHEVDLWASAAFARCELLQAQGMPAEANAVLFRARARLDEATRDEPRLAKTPLAERLAHQIDARRQS